MILAQYRHCSAVGVQVTICELVLTWHSVPHILTLVAPHCAAPSGKVTLMKIFVLPLLFASASALTFAADNASLGGKWQVHGSVAGNDSDQSCTFTQKDTDLTGTCTTNESKTVNVTGKVDGKKVTWSYKSDYNGSPLTVNYDGKLDSD